jgi:hypothetical protein
MRNHDIIDSRCPDIRPSNWKDQNKLGWRWYKNVFARTVSQNEHVIQQLQYENGITNVTVGDSWSDDFMRPIYDPLWVGIYIRDIPALVDQFLKELEMWWENL